MTKVRIVAGALLACLLVVLLGGQASAATTWNNGGTSYYAYLTFTQGQTVPVPVSATHDVEVYGNGVATQCTAGYVLTGGCASGTPPQVCAAATCAVTLRDYGVYDSAGNDVGGPTSGWAPYLADPAGYLTGATTAPPTLADRIGSVLLDIAAAVGAMVLAGAVVAFLLFGYVPMFDTAARLLRRLGWGG